MDSKRLSQAPQGRIKGVELQAAADLQKEAAGGSHAPPRAGGQTKYETFTVGNQIRHRCPYCQRDDYDRARMDAHVQLDHQSEVRAKREESHLPENLPKSGESANMRGAQEAKGPKDSHKGKKLIRRSAKYEEIDEALRKIAEARPKNHEEVFRRLDDRTVPIPNRRTFKSAGGWLKGFQHNRHSAGAWLSQAWGRLSLPAFQRGPKK